MDTDTNVLVLSGLLVIGFLYYYGKGKWTTPGIMYSKTNYNINPSLSITEQYARNPYKYSAYYFGGPVF